MRIKRSAFTYQTLSTRNTTFDNLSEIEADAEHSERSMQFAQL